MKMRLFGMFLLRFGMFLLRFGMYLLISAALMIPNSTAATELFNFPPFPTNGSTMRLLGDAQLDEGNNSIVMNRKSVAMSSGTCAMLTYDGHPNLQGSTLASFNTSFTFKFTTSPTQRVWDVNGSTNSMVATSLVFLLLSTPSDSIDETRAARATWAEQAGACKGYTQGDSSYFGVVFNNGNSFSMGEPSNNFIGIIDKENGHVFNERSTYNLCGKQTKCSYLSNGEYFTAWINFISPNTLQVGLSTYWYSNIQWPPFVLLAYSNISLSIQRGDHLLLTFLGSSDENNIQTHELSSWTFSVSGTEKLSSSPTKKWIPLLLGIGSPFVILLVSIFFILRLIKRRRSVPFSYSTSPRVFLYNELSAATKNFNESEKLGSGGFGTVYKGSFHSSDEAFLLAVKRINYDTKHAHKTFLAEISSLSQIKHRNVVKLLGWCNDKDRLLLVYDYMPNGNLHKWLHESKGALSWRMRHGIIQGVAAALEYLHKDCPQCILHRDIKSSNIMLDASFEAHLGDFGLARLMDHQNLDKTTNAAGTMGYMAPEMPHTGKATKQSDVYSFGILLLEVVCRRRPLDLHAQEPEDMVLLQSVWRAHEAGTILRVADQTCQMMEPQNCINCQPTHAQVPEAAIVETANSVSDDVEKIMVKYLLHLGLLCCLPDPRARPAMGEVVHILQEIGDINSEDYGRNISMPHVPDTKPLGVYSSLEFSQILDQSL